MGRWYPVFAEGVKMLPWKVFCEKYLPLVRNIANLGYTPITRYAGAKILIATLEFAASANTDVEKLASDYCDLFKSIDLNIRVAALECSSELLPKLECKAEILRELLNSFKDMRDETCSKAMVAILKLSEYFSVEQLREEFVPEFVEKTLQRKEYKEVNRTMMEMLGEFIELFISRNLVAENLTSALYKIFEAAWKSSDIVDVIAIIPALPSMARLEFFLQKESFAYQGEMMSRIKFREFFLPFSREFAKVGFVLTPASKSIPGVRQAGAAQEHLHVSP